MKIIEYYSNEIKVNNIEFMVFCKFWNNVIAYNRYNTLNSTESKIIKKIYRRINLPFESTTLWNLPNDLRFGISDKIIISNDGPYIEFNRYNIDYNNLVIKNNYVLSENELELFRYEPEGMDNITVLYCSNPVEYGEFKAGYFYVNPFQLKIKEDSHIKNNSVTLQSQVD